MEEKESPKKEKETREGEEKKKNKHMLMLRIKTSHYKKIQVSNNPKYHWDPRKKSKNTSAELSTW